MVVQSIGRGFTKVFGSRNERVIKQYHKRVALINAREPEIRRLTDAQLRAKTQEFRDDATQDRATVLGGAGESRLIEIMAVAREAMDRAVGIRGVFNPELNFNPSKFNDPRMESLYAELKAKADATDPLPVEGGHPAPGYLQIDIPNEFYDAVRKLYPESKPPFRARPFDVQLIGGMVLGEGKIAEMRTGEGKTIVAPLACYVACCDTLRCHVVTVNDYLVQRDRDWVFPFYHFLGLTVSAIHPMHMQPPAEKARAYTCDVLYATNSELGFDYLRDNMKLSTQEQVQKARDFVVIDEVDSILIDEARTPLIISGPAHEDAPRYDVADKIARHLMQKQVEWDKVNERVEKAEMRIKGLEGDARNARDKAKANEYRAQMKAELEKLPELEAERDRHVQYFEVEMEKKAAHLTHEGTAEAQRVAGVGSFYVGNNMDMPHLVTNAVRAHAVYRRDHQYVVQNGEVVIVDEFTGRLMVGRQWSDGLHQAVESKEGVKIKQETQTLATVTIQNFFKLYKRLAGMTGTAITEATEFHEIYGMDVISIPTNKPIARIDRDDLIFLSAKDKWDSIVDEIKRVHDIGRPVLVGTTSVDKSEMLSAMLSKKHGIKHAVLNAKAENAEREGNIVEDAGQLGAVMIATNMAGRGTDIKLHTIDREALIKHWQTRNILSRQADPSMDDAALVAMSYRHQAINTLGVPKKEAESLSDDELKLRLLRHWCTLDAFVEDKRAETLSMDECLRTLDGVPDYKRHRMEVWPRIEAMGGLHIVGTERHEARRIDNQLRGRAGRQGDQGSSRFFLSLEDDLMKMFAGKATMTALSKLGMKEGDAIEHRWVSKSVSRAQRKVEERNYEIRKNLLEYDEVMEHQRNQFYGIRQDVLEGRNIQELIFDYIGESVDDAVGLYLAPDYVRQQAAEWCRSQLDVSVDPARLHLDSLDEMQNAVRKSARAEVAQIVDTSLGEYMSLDAPPEDWDLKGLSSWAMSRFGVNLPQARLKNMNPTEVSQELAEAARQQVDKKDLSGLAKFLDEDIPYRELSEWAKQKFGLELPIEEIKDEDPAAVARDLLDKARAAYARREVTYPVEFAMEIITQGAAQDANWAAAQLIGMVKSRYLLDWTPEDINGLSGKDVFDKLVAEQEAWLKEGGKLRQEADAMAAEHGHNLEQLRQKLAERYGVEVTPDEMEQAAGRPAPGRPASAGRESPAQETLLADFVYEKGREAFRSELTRLERFVLLQILDQAWKDHLYAMDQLKDSIGLRGYAEKDPRIEYKREGAAQFREMQKTLRDRVTDLIFRARLTPNVRLQSPNQQQVAQHAAAQAGAAQQHAHAAAEAAQGPTPGAHPAAGAAPARVPARPTPEGLTAGRGEAPGAPATAEQQADLDAADQAGAAPRRRTMSRKQRRAAEARERKDGGSKRKRRR